MKDDKQITFYNSGIGTYAKPSFKFWNYCWQVIENKIDLMFALYVPNARLGPVY